MGFVRGQCAVPVVSGVAVPSLAVHVGTPSHEYYSGSKVPTLEQQYSMCEDCGASDTDDEGEPSDPFHYEYDSDEASQFVKPWEFYGGDSD
jgi:hypothetical protein